MKDKTFSEVMKDRSLLCLGAAVDQLANVIDQAHLGGRPAAFGVNRSMSPRRTKERPPTLRICSRSRWISRAIAWRDTPRRRAASACEIQSCKSCIKLVDFDNLLVLPHRLRPTVCLDWLWCEPDDCPRSRRCCGKQRIADPQEDQLYRAWGAYYLAQGELDRAASYYEKAIDMLHPEGLGLGQTDPDYSTLATIYAKQGNHRAAAKAYEEDCFAMVCAADTAYRFGVELAAIGDRDKLNMLIESATDKNEADPLRTLAKR